MRFTRRQFLGSLGVLTAGGAAYAGLVEPGRLELTRTAVALAAGRLRRPLRILHLADFHASAVVPFSLIEAAVDLGLSQAPDLVCLTGDFITRALPEPERYAAILGRLARAAPAFACPGNHDGGAWAVGHGGYADLGPLEGLMRDSGIALLRNQARALSVAGQPLVVAGVGDLWAGELSPPPLPEGAEGPTVLLSHNPDSKDDLRDVAWDVLLCGHTHGGQVSLPFFGPPIVPVRDRRYIQGLHRWEGRWIYITRGVGNIWGVRFNCRPEVSLLELL